MKQRKKQKDTLKRSFSVFGLLTISFCVALFSVVQFYLMDDIFALAAKISMLDSAEEISEIDFQMKPIYPQSPTLRQKEAFILRCIPTTTP